MINGTIIGWPINDSTWPRLQGIRSSSADGISHENAVNEWDTGGGGRDSHMKGAGMLVGNFEETDLGVAQAFFDR